MNFSEMNNFQMNFSEMNNFQMNFSEMNNYLPISMYLNVSSSTYMPA